MSRPPKIETRERILESAHDLIYKNGFNGVSMEEIAEAAGLKKANLFHYFPTKDRLAVAVFDYATRGFQERWAARLKSNDDPVSLVSTLFGTTMEGMQECRCVGGCFIGNLAQELSDCNEAVRQRVAEHLQSWQRQLTTYFARLNAEKRFRADFDPAGTAQALLSLFQGALLVAKATRDATALGRSRDFAVAFLRAQQFPDDRPPAPNGDAATPG